MTTVAYLPTDRQRLLGNQQTKVRVDLCNKNLYRVNRHAIVLSSYTESLNSTGLCWQRIWIAI